MANDEMRTIQTGDLRIRTMNIHDDEDAQFVDCDFQLWHCVKRERDEVKMNFIAKFSDLWSLIEYAQEEFPYSHVFDDDQLISYPYEDRDESIPNNT